MQIGKYSGKSGRKSEKRAKAKRDRLDWKRLGEDAPKKNYYRGYED